MSPSQSLRLEGTHITRLPEGKVKRLLPEPIEDLEAKEVYQDLLLPKRGDRPYVLINMVSSLDGKATVNGKSGPIGGPIDRIVMRKLRVRADAVLVGASTLRSEKLTLSVTSDLALQRASLGLKPQPLAVLTTISGELPLEDNLLDAAFDNVLVIATPSTPSARIKEISDLASVEIAASLEETLKILKERYSVDVLLVEGGPSLNYALMSQGLVDELFLTLAPKLLGGKSNSALTILEGPPFNQSVRLKPVSIHVAEGELFLRYRNED